jgi:hypothetical protein
MGIEHHHSGPGKKDCLQLWISPWIIFESCTLNPEDSQKACPVSGLSICPDGMMGLTGRVYKTG